MHNSILHISIVYGTTTDGHLSQAMRKARVCGMRKIRFSINTPKIGFIPYSLAIVICVRWQHLSFVVSSDRASIPDEFIQVDSMSGLIEIDQTVDFEYPTQIQKVGESGDQKSRQTFCNQNFPNSLLPRKFNSACIGHINHLIFLIQFSVLRSPRLSSIVFLF